LRIVAPHKKALRRSSSWCYWEGLNTSQSPAGAEPRGFPLGITVFLLGLGRRALLLEPRANSHPDYGTCRALLAAGYRVQVLMQLSAGLEVYGEDFVM
jgi:hypothetical protein